METIPLRGRLNTNHIQKRELLRPHTEGRTRNIHDVWPVADASDRADENMDNDTDPDGLVQEVTDKDRRIGMTFSVAVSMKGGSDPHAARLLSKWIDELACQEVTVRTDVEPSICELIRRVRELRAEGTTIVDGQFTRRLCRQWVC